MSTTSELIRRLRELKVKLSVENGELKVSAPKGALTPELRAELVERKQEIRALLAPVEVAARATTIPRARRDQPIPLSFTQQRLWFLDQMEPGLLTYNMWSTAVLHGRLDVALFRRCLTEIVRRHEVLRTTFRDQDGVPVQVIAPEPGFPFELVDDQRDGRHEHTDDEIRRELWGRLEQPFDLAAGPLLRVTLLRLAAEKHVLFVVVHHIVSDGLSTGLFFQELFALYEAFERGEPSPLPALPIQYADFAIWQRAFFEGPEFERQMAYWRRTLSGELPLLELPLDHPRPPIQTYHGQVKFEWFPAEILRGLDALANRESSTLFVVLLAAYKAFLQRLTGQTDVLVGIAAGNRNRPEIENLIGFFVNTLVLRTDVGGEPSFRQLVGRVRDVFLGAIEYQDMPFERLVDELQPERNLAYSPLFQTFFVLDQDSGHSRQMGQIEVKPFELENHATRTDLVMHSFRGRDKHGTDGLCVGLEYNTDLFDEATIVRWLQHFKVLLKSVVADPERPVSRADLLGQEERARLLEGWNRPRAAYPDLPVHEQFEAQVDRTPEATAAVYATDDAGADERLTYRELEQRANRLARLLRARGVAPGDLVGLCLKRSLDMLVAQLGIQKAGAAYVPLDPAFPPERLAYMVADAGIRLVVATSDQDELVAAAPERLHLDRAARELAAQDPARFPSGADADALMYVIYTSGSTGRPKGVEIAHRSVSNFLASMAAAPGLAAGERWLAVTTLSFDISVLETMLPLVVGATVWIASRETTMEGDRLLALLERARPDVMQATPATWRMLLLAGWESSPGLKVLSGGEALPRDLANELARRGRELWNLYGPTETTVWSTVARVDAGDGPVRIGRPIASTRVYVLDRHHEPVPVGVPGELWIAGDGLARGYHGRPELTAERFVADPFAPEPGARMYRTGDLARRHPDGELECLGRIDNQVKLRGYRIELGEIEAVLQEEPGVRQCVALVREDTPGDQRLVANCVPDAGVGVDPARLRERGRARLPAYMVPSAFVALEALPLTPNGKVDRRALLALKPEPPAGPARRTAPRNAAEAQIAQVWQAVLGLEELDVDTNFFDLGGHSLLLAQVRARLQGDFPGVSIIELFQDPTVAALAQHLAGRGAAAEEPADQKGRGLAAGRQALMRRRRIRG